VTGTLQVLGFSVLNGVMNAGGPTNLLLAVPGCPSGDAVSFLLGYWVVWDAGGTICLGPSAANNLLAAVDCEFNLTDSPWVVGFSSSAVSPCAGGAAPCDSLEALNASYQEQQMISGSLIRGADWSPVGSLLVFNDASQCFVIDAGSKSPKPLLIYESAARRVCWAPDGTWVVIETRTPEQHRRGASTLVAIPADGGAAVKLLDDSLDLGFVAWGDDGLVYYWNRESGARSSLAPPRSWSDSYKPPDAVRPLLVERRVPGLTGSDRYVFWPGAPEDRRTLLSSFSSDRRTLVVFVDAFAVKNHFLVRVYEPEVPGYDLILDELGQVVVDFRDTDDPKHLMRSSVSPDGRFLVAYDPQDDGHRITSSQMYICDVASGDRVPIYGAPMGLDPRLSQNGSMIAFEGLDGGIHVGGLVVTGP
jgi:hypothetical protein